MSNIGKVQRDFKGKWIDENRTRYLNYHNLNL